MMKRRRMPKGCTIDGVKMREDCGLTIEKLTLPLPEPKTDTESPAGVDGVIDYSEVDGDVCFENREIKIEFGVSPEDRWKFAYALDKYDLLSMLNGRRSKVIFEDDPDFYYEGRLRVTSYTPYAIMPKIVVEMDAHPFKRELLKQHMQFQIPYTIYLKSSDFSLDNSRTTAQYTNEWNAHAGPYQEDNEPGFIIRGEEGQVSAWRLNVDPTKNYAFFIQQYRQVKEYGGYFEVRSAFWKKLDPSNFRSGTGYVYIVFVCEMQVDYRWYGAVLIPLEADAGITIENGRERVIPQLSAPVECLMVYNGKVILIEPEGSWQEILDTRLTAGRSTAWFAVPALQADGDHAGLIVMEYRRGLF
jgi:hypothetical protein